MNYPRRDLSVLLTLRRTALAIAALCGALQAQDTLLSRPDVKAALDYLEQHHDEHLQRQIRIAEIPAPGFQEEKRAAFIADEFRRLGLTGVEIDPQGNVLGWRRGASDQALVIAAHLDTVFPAGTDVKVKRIGNRYNGPGLVDDSRGLAALLAIVEALDAGRIRTKRSILFVADVGEEGLGSLRGIRYLFEEGKDRDRLKAFISIDGTGAAITTKEIGSRRYRVMVRGPGGHSWGNFGRVNPIHALGRVIADFAGTQTPPSPKTTYNVGRIGGGTSVNSIPFEAWAEVDMRSEDDAELMKVDQQLLAAARRGVDEENRQRLRSDTRLELETKLLAVRPSGKTPEDSPLVKAAAWATRAMGLQPAYRWGSTDSNVPMSRGVPAITLGGGGRSGNMHSLEEWFDPADAYKGVQQILLTALAFDET